MSRNTLVIDPRMNSGASANSTEALVLSTRVAFLRKSYTLSYKGCYPNPAQNMPYEFDECFSMRKMEFAMTRLFSTLKYPYYRQSGVRDFYRSCRNFT